VSTIRIILVDDHELVRTGLRALIDATPGLDIVGESSNGADAIAQTLALRPDAVVMDISMPVLDGADATERLTRECPEVKVLALTAHDDRAHVTRLMQAGAAGYVLKRCAADELVRAIHTVADGGTWVDPALAGSILREEARHLAEDAATPGADALSEREEQVLRNLAWGRSNKETAERLGVSTKTVETYRARITEKLGLRARTDLVRFAIRQGWLAEDSAP
jgi:two-component system, NarL family, response regulator NreC